MVQLDERISLIQQIGLFRGVDPTELESIAQQMTETSFRDGEVAFLEGDTGDRLYLILTGAMHVYVEREGSVISYDHLQPGECFGEMALVEEAPRSATVKSEGTSLCLTLSKEDLLDLMNRQPNIALGMIKGLVGRLRGTNVQLQEYARRLINISDELVEINFAGYDQEGFYDEMLREDGTPRDGSALLVRQMESLPPGEC